MTKIQIFHGHDIYLTKATKTVAIVIDHDDGQKLKISLVNYSRF